MYAVRSLLSGHLGDHKELLDWRLLEMSHYAQLKYYSGLTHGVLAGQLACLCVWVSACQPVYVWVSARLPACLLACVCG